MKKEYRKINDEIVNDTLKMYMGAPVEDYSADRLRDFVDSTRIFVKRNRFNPIVEDVNVVKYFISVAEMALSKLKQRESKIGDCNPGKMYDIMNAATFFYNKLNSFMKDQDFSSYDRKEVLEKAYETNVEMLALVSGSGFENRRIEKDFIVKSIQRAASHRSNLAKNTCEDIDIKKLWISRAYKYSMKHLKTVEIEDENIEDRNIRMKAVRQNDRKETGVFFSIKTMADLCKDMYMLIDDSQLDEKKQIAKKGYVLTKLFLDMYKNGFDDLIRQPVIEKTWAIKTIRYFLEQLDEDEKIEISDMIAFKDKRTQKPFYTGELKLK